MEEDWNVDSYRNKFEPDEQWDMRKKFMEANKHNLSEDRAVCLAQVLVNMEFLGTKYPSETMRTVNELSQDIIGEFREREKTRLQRTFVDGTEAANAKVKGTQPTSTSKSEIEKKIAETNANYFLSAILSSSSKSVVKEETTSKQKRNSKCNPSPEDSTKNDSRPKSELSSRKRKNKKETFAVEETSTDNVTSSKCMAPRQLEDIVEPIRKKKKLKNKKVKEMSTDNVASSKCMAPCQSAEIVEPIHKKKKLKNKNETSTDNVASSKCVAPFQSEEIVEPIRKKKKLKNKKVKETSTDNVASSKYMAPHQSEAIVEPIRKNRKLKNKNVEIANPNISNFVIIMLENEKNRVTQSTSGQLIMHPVNYRQIIESSARLSDVKLQVRNSFLADQGKWESVLSLDDKTITSSLGENEKTAQKIIYKLAFPILEKSHYQIIVTDKKCNSVGQFMSQEEDARLTRVENTFSTTITKEVIGGKTNETLDSALQILSKGENAVAKPVNATAAMKMMKMMGWTEGTGLGLQKQGIVEPIKSDVVVGRKGIGYDGSGNVESFIQLIRCYLRNYKNSASVHNIVFSNEFSNEERKHVHLIARQMGLLSSSIGREPNRQLTVRRSPCKPRPLIELLNQLIKSKGSDPLFSRIELIQPTG